MNKWLYNVFWAGSIFLNAVIGGTPPGSLCGRAWRANRDGKRWGSWFMRVVCWFDPDHFDGFGDHQAEGKRSAHE